ncbi:MAG: transporter substrate-binding domain-containing protein [Lentisphaerae bacterium]|nr:transporter substrate-binding domain-containing protein [Lentisphaerota bacterium]MCP4101344.1 transporter substrate-binding domain-containing protein [Lentisphaerota bacterium]
MKFLRPIALLLLAVTLCSCSDEKNAPVTRKKGIIRVLTAGDYKPFTHYNTQTAKYSGFAVDMAYSLGKALKKKVVFVKTTWPEMGNDLLAGKADIAMGGICATASRKRYFLISGPVIASGKVLLIRKADINKYKNLADVDKKGVVIVENKGGTNEIFARNNIKNARLVFSHDNVTPFDYLLTGKADAMITDRVEAIYKSNTHRKLYAVNTSKPFTNTYKVYLLPKKNKKLLAKVNQWLKEVKNDGTLERLLKKNRVKLTED